MTPDCGEHLESEKDDEYVLEGEDEDDRRNNREAFVKITLNFLRRMNENELADRLESSKWGFFRGMYITGHFPFRSQHNW